MVVVYILLAFTLFAIFLLFKHTNKNDKKIIKITKMTGKISLGILALMLILIIVLPKGEKQTVAQKQETKKEEPKKEKNEKKNINDMTIDEYIKSTDSSIIEVTNALDNTGYILIKDKFNSEHSKDIAFEICEILEKVQKHKDYSKVKKVGIMIMADFTDTYGKVTVAKSLSMDIGKTEVDKINWSNFEYTNIYKLSSDLWVHPSIKK